MLQSVEIGGNEVTRGKVLTQALRFELGKPVDLDEWTLARKRLYDTNVFRLVDIQPCRPASRERRPAGQGRQSRIRLWSVRYGFQIASAGLELDEFTSTRNAGVVGESGTPTCSGAR